MIHKIIPQMCCFGSFLWYQSSNPSQRWQDRQWQKTWGTWGRIGEWLLWFVLKIMFFSLMISHFPHTTGVGRCPWGFRAWLWSFRYPPCCEERFSGDTFDCPMLDVELNWDWLPSGNLTKNYWKWWFSSWIYPLKMVDLSIVMWKFTRG